MGNCIRNSIDERRTKRLAAQLETLIATGSLDDIRAVLERGAPVNFQYKEVGGT